jgi:hypothetical protein
VIAGAESFPDDGGSFRLKPCEKDAGLYLGAWDGGGVVNRMQWLAMNGDGGVAFSKDELRAH